jgi:hypothetical protein
MSDAISSKEQVTLPAWGMCQLKVQNEEYRRKNGLPHEIMCEADQTPTALERFLYEYEDADPVRNEQFLRMFKAVLVEARSTPHEPPDVPRDNYGRAEPPHGYAYRYHALGGDVLRFNSGEPVNGGKPFEAVPYWLGKPPAQPQGVDDLYLMLVRRGYAQHEADEIAKMTARIESGMPAQPPETVPVPDKAEGTDVCRWCYFTPDKCICTSQPPNPVQRRFDVLAITTAYESGFGHGREMDNLPNPYTEGGSEHHAYSIGYEEGESRRRKNGSSGYCNQGAHELCTNSECMCACHTPTKRAGHVYSPREGTEVCFICGFHKREHAQEQMP